jgi:hypothetical protein
MPDHAQKLAVPGPASSRRALASGCRMAARHSWLAWTGQAGMASPHVPACLPLKVEQHKIALLESEQRSSTASPRAVASQPSFPSPAAPAAASAGSGTDMAELVAAEAGQAGAGGAAAPPQVVTMCRAGDAVGELSFFTGLRSPVSATSKQLCRVLVINKAVSAPCRCQPIGGGRAACLLGLWLRLWQGPRRVQDLHRLHHAPVCPAAWRVRGLLARLAHETALHVHSQPLHQHAVQHRSTSLQHLSCGPPSHG